MAGIELLPYNFHHSLSQLLNPEHPLGNDWRGLAGRLGLTAQDVANLERERDPMREVLHKWSQKGKTYGDLEAALKEMGRSDCVQEMQKWFDEGMANVYRQKGSLPHSPGTSLLYTPVLFFDDNEYYAPSSRL